MSSAQVISELTEEDWHVVELAWNREPKLRRQFEFYLPIFVDREISPPDSVESIVKCQVGGHAIEGSVLWCAECEQFQCKRCCHDHHNERLHLHRLLMWENDIWNTFDLNELGISVQLGHKPGTPCPSPCNLVNNFTVVHVNGVHKVSVLFCGCGSGPPMWVQSMQRLWVPNSNWPTGAVTYSAREWARSQGDDYALPSDAM